MRPDGQRRLYRLKPEPFRELDQWLAQYRSLWEAALTAWERAREATDRAENPQKRSRQMNDENKSAAACAYDQAKGCHRAHIPGNGR